MQLEEMKNLPLISIIVPIYNVEDYLPCCIDSILNQSYHNIEIILVNDGSSDNCENICLSYVNTDKRIHYIYQDNLGISTARNTGLRLVKGEYIYFIDADDYIHPQTIEILYNSLIEGNYDFSMILAKATFKQDIKPIKISHPIKKKVVEQNYLMKGLFNLAIEEELQYQVVWNKLYKKEILKNLYFIKTGTEDTEFNCRVYQKCNKAILIHLPLYNWVQRTSSITHQPINENYIDRMNSYYHCLNNIQNDKIAQKGYCLEKLYKTMINIRYYARKTQYERLTLSNIKKIRSKTFFSFLTSKIPLVKKIGLTIFLYIPIIYKFFFICVTKISNSKNSYI